MTRSSYLTVTRRATAACALALLLVPHLSAQEGTYSISSHHDFPAAGLLTQISPAQRQVELHGEGCEAIVSLASVRVLDDQGWPEGDLELRTRTKLFRLPPANPNGGVPPWTVRTHPSVDNPPMSVDNNGDVEINVELAVYQFYADDPPSITVATEVDEIDDFFQFGDDSGFATDHLELSCFEETTLELDVQLHAGHFDIIGPQTIYGPNGEPEGVGFVIETGSAPDGLVRLTYVARPHGLREEVLEIVPEHRQIHFQNVVPGDARAKQVHIVNPTDAPQRVQIEGVDTGVLFWPTVDRVLPPLSSMGVVVSYTPAAAGISRATMEILNDTTGDRTRVRIRGRALPPPPQVGEVEMEVP